MIELTPVSTTLEAVEKSIEIWDILKDRNTPDKAEVNEEIYDYYKYGCPLCEFYGTRYSNVKNAKGDAGTWLGYCADCPLYNEYEGDRVLCGNSESIYEEIQFEKDHPGELLPGYLEQYIGQIHSGLLRIRQKIKEHKYPNHRLPY